ncbi:MAG: c-type cytochrome [Candidatus Eiseniibacteriota bacterium]
MLRVALLLVAGVTGLLGAATCPALAQEGRAPAAELAGVAPIPLYEQHCARCHGEHGRGDGPHAAGLEPPPRDFLGGRFKLKTTYPNTPPTIENVADTIRRGMTGTAMPAFEGILSDREIEVLAVHVFTLTGRTPSRRSMRVASVPDRGVDSVVLGKRLYERLGCADCHGEGGLGDGPAVPRLENADGSPVIVTDLTRPWTFKGGWRRIDIALRILAGMEGTPMTGYRDASLRADQLYSLVDYVLSLRRSEDLLSSAARDFAVEEGVETGIERSLTERGRRLVSVLSCDHCHTPIDGTGAPIDSLRLAGGTRMELYPLRDIVASNLTPHATGLGGVGLDAFKRMMRRGRTPDRRRLDPIAMPWPHYASLTDADLEAMYAYLASLEPVANQIPATRELGGLDTLIFKARALSGGPTARVIMHPGNAGMPGGQGPKPPRIDDRSWRRLSGLLGIVLLIEFLYLWRPFMVSGLRRRRRRHHRPLRERIRGPFFALSIIVSAAIVAVAWWPPDHFGTAGQTIDLVAPELPEPAGVSGRMRTIAEHGRYLTGVAGCASCHTDIDPLWPMSSGAVLGGDHRVSWALLGDWEATSLIDYAGRKGGADRLAFRRLMRSGIIPGRAPVEPAAMPWNRSGRLSAEELEAMYIYLASIGGAAEGTVGGGDQGANERTADRAPSGAADPEPATP